MIEEAKGSVNLRTFTAYSKRWTAELQQVSFNRQEKIGHIEKDTIAKKNALKHSLATQENILYGYSSKLENQYDIH